jgi:hypothetical protein
MHRYSEQLYTNPRAKRRLEPRIVYTGNGFQITEFVGGEGDYWDVKFPESSILTMPYFSLFPRGGMEAVSEIDGIWYMADKDHPYSVKLNPDGSPSSEPHYIRLAGRTRMFFKEDTHRLCIYPINGLGEPAMDLIEFKHVRGPSDILLPKGSMFVVASGEVLVDGRNVVGPNVVHVKTRDNVPARMMEHSYGAIAWKV